MSALSLSEAAELALASARQRGADQAEVSLQDGAGVSLTVRQGELETIERHNDCQLSISVYKDHKTGAASSADLTTNGIVDTVEAALSIASFTGVDEALGLADAERMATDLPDLDLYHPWGVSTTDLIDIATRCESAAMAQDKRIDNSEGASVSSYTGSSIYANSHGFYSAREGSHHSLSCSVIASDEQGMQRDYWYDSQRDPAQLASAESIGARAGQRTAARLGAKKLSSQVAPVLFDPSMAKSLLSHLLGALKGGAIYKKASFLLDQVGQTIAPPFLTLSEFPQLVGGSHSAAHDAEGVATPEQRAIVAEGVLQSYVLGSYTARKLGLESTANAGGVRNVRVTNTGQSQTELCQQMQRGLLVTELIGSGLNMVTGDYSRGAAGFWVENGEIAYPVEEITIAGNVRDMLQQIIAIGSDEDPRGNIHCGSILLESMTIAGS